VEVSRRYKLLMEDSAFADFFHDLMFNRYLQHGKDRSAV